MSENIPQRHDYNAITPFRLFVKTNFPFIENTFESLDNYGLYCKVVEYLNKVIDEQNKVSADMVTFTDFITNYFENLDVQEEINNKLDEMAESGVLYNVLADYFSDIEEDIQDNFERMYSLIASATSGSPSGVYPTFDALVAANPDHTKIYLVTADGKWYYYNNTLSAWTAGGTYQGTSVDANDPVIQKINDRLDDAFSDFYNLVRDENIVTVGSSLVYRVYLEAGNVYYYNQLSNSMYGINVRNANLQVIGTFNSIVSQVAWNTTFTCPENAYCIDIPVNANYTPYVGTSEDYQLWVTGKTFSLKDNVYVEEVENLINKIDDLGIESITIGTNGDFASVKAGFEYAIANNKIAIILPGTYNLVTEGITGTGYTVPKKVIGYGAKLVCNLSEEDWNLSPLNINPEFSETIIEGLEIECSNCRYAIHDEMYNRANEYHNVYKNLTITNNSVASQVLIAPRAIGGGLGNKGYVEIENCIINSNIHYGDVDYHSNGTGTQTGNCTVYVKDSVFKNAISVTAIGSSTDFMNTMYVSNCLFGSHLPVTEDKINIRMIAWNNVLAQ